MLDSDVNDNLYQLVFNLTDAVQWTESYCGLSFTALYEFLVDYFEDASASPTIERQLKSLLKWWNRYVLSSY